MPPTPAPLDLTQHLAHAIANGQHPVGSLLPNELQLCAQHGLSRYAVRKALDTLQARGLISRRKNVGTRVEAQHPRAGFEQAIGTVDELAQFGARHRRVIQSSDTLVADLDLAAELGCPGGSRWIRISSLREASSHSDGAEPLCWTDVYVDAAFTGIAALAAQAPHTLISALIETHHGRSIERIQQHIDAVALPDALAIPLRAEPGSPALRVTRRYADAQGRVFEITRSIHPAGRFALSMEVRRSRQAPGA